ncbi:hypothetical protein I3843_10G008800 [Carya illinoinensis]|uniref:Germin-like protein n=1 Tax=Carya illinoinensis TaxID=32201 RepID=A0A922DTA3_CARIL|nr:hypothetical protein I3760_10G008400 [Carya illinoinensis]KAG6690314.1 hypothetical protein I3842_10G008700 [Carya illinoinensis]KAG7958218.1 hypothetical protein I3843_10G008800 [Carya illinoinensis]
MLSTFLLTLILISLHCFTTSASDPDPVQDFCIPNPKYGFIRAADHLTILPCKNSSEATPDDFVFSGMKRAGNFSETGLVAIPVNPTIFPGINTLGMSFIRADLKAGGINPPHFHPKATEISYVVQGSVYSGLEGEVMVFPRGLLHFQMNVGDKPATIFGGINSQNPG